METLWQDLRYGARQLARSPGFTVVAVLTLALGIGANTAIFSVVHAVLLEPLPFPNSDRLVALSGQSPIPSPGLGLTEVEYLRIRSGSETLEGLGGHFAFQMTLSGAGEPRRVRTGLVTSELFSVLGVQPILGRVFLEEEQGTQNIQSAILSHELWQAEFGGASDVLGRSILLNARPFTVVGVMPRGFRLPSELGAADPAQIWVPLPFDRENPNWGSHYLNGVGRLRPGVEAKQADAEVKTIVRRLAQERPEAYDVGLTVGLRPLRSDLTAESRQGLLVLLGAVGLVLLIACANVANLLLARATAREKEFAVRAALGGGRMRLVRQLLTESLLLGALGGAAGLLLALWGFGFILGLAPGSLPRAVEAGVNAPLLAFAAGVSVLTILLFGLAPALRTTALDIHKSLKEEGRGLSLGSSRQRLLRGFVVAQVALAVVLTIGAGLLLESFWRLLHVDTGFNPSNLLTAQVTLPGAVYRERQQVSEFYARLLQETGRLPGATAVAAVNRAPLRGWGGDTFFDVEGRPTAQEDAPRYASYGSQPPHMAFRAVTPGYFSTLGIRLLKGRALQEGDGFEGPLAVVVNETLAQRFFKAEEPLGKRLRLYWSVDQRGEWAEIVGVVADSKLVGLDEEKKAELYVTVAQAPRLGGWVPRDITLLVRTPGEPQALAEPVRQVVRQLDSALPVYNVQTMDEIISGTVARPRFTMTLVSLFAAVALLLAAVGIYGVIAYSVNQRLHEIGIRLALGAQPTSILMLVVGKGMLLVLVGLLAGVGGALGLTRFLATLLFGVSPTNPMTYGGVAVLLGLVALAACWMPARRAMRVDPMVALRYE
ncbi:MAG: ABC transporter permease [Candidatus Acidiferrales bacterium]